MSQNRQPKIYCSPPSHRLVPIVEDLLEVADLKFLEVDILQIDLFVVPQLADLFIFLLQLLTNLKVGITILMYSVFPLYRKVWMMTFCKVPSADGLIQQLPTAHAGQWNIPKCHLPNLATERKKHSVVQMQIQAEYKLTELILCTICTTSYCN